MIAPNPERSALHRGSAIKPIPPVDEILEGWGLVAKHLAGRHDQARHGHRAGTSGTPYDVSTAEVRGIRDTGGATIRLGSGRVPHTGYMASVPGHEEPHPLEAVDAALIRGYIGRNRDALDEPGNYLGAWHDQSSGLVYLDVSRHFQSEARARDFGNSSNQLAIFNLNAGPGENPEIRLRKSKRVLAGSWVTKAQVTRWVFDPDADPAEIAAEIRRIVGA